MGCVVSLRGRRAKDACKVSGEEMSSWTLIQCPEYTDNITSDQKQIVSDTWEIVKEDIAKVGVITFMRLFEKHPDVQDLFVPFRGLKSDELRNNVRLREHGLRVMGTIEKAIARLDKPEKLHQMLYELGNKHKMFDTKVEYLELICPVLLHSIKPAIGGKWTPEVEDAWQAFFKMIVAFMRAGMIS